MPAALRPHFALIALLPLAVGCLHITAKKVDPEFPDRGLELPGNPYDHLAAPEYSQGRITGFRELFVEADTFVDAAAPSKPLAVESATSDATLPEGFAPVLVATLDMSALDEGRTVEDVIAAVAERRDAVVVAMPTEGLIVLKAPADRRAQTVLQREVGGTSVDGVPLTTLGSLAIVDAVPQPIAEGEVLPPAEGSKVLWVAPAPPPAAPAPETGTLPLDNITTSYAEVSLNGNKVGVVPPLAKARIHELKSGIYEVGYVLPNGFTWTETLETRNDLGPRVKVAADQIVINEPIYFETDKADIQVRSFSLLDEIAETLEEHPELTKVRVEGHTDSDGSAAYNEGLSARRAAAVVDALVERGVGAGRLTSVGLGETRPVASNASAQGKALNRRVEFHIEGRQGSSK